MDAPPSFEFAKEVTTQLITLSTAVIGVTTTFTKDISGKADKWTRGQLYGSWICFLCSIIFGVFTLGAMTGILAASHDVAPEAIYSGNIRGMSLLQIGLFLTACSLLIAHAIRAANK